MTKEEKDMQLEMLRPPLSVHGIFFILED